MMDIESEKLVIKDWNKCKLGEIVDISSSKRIYAKEYMKHGIPFYRSKEIIEKNNGNEVSSKLYISRERFNELKYKFGVPKKGDILLTSVGTLGVPYIVKNEEFYFKDGNLTWLKNFKNNYLDKFIYYWILSDYGKNQINSRCIGSTQKALTIDALKKFDITIPPIQEQKAIAHILSTLDEKIEVNNQINKTLEKMAQLIFKHWFVDFEFPNKEGKAYKSSGGKMVESELGMIPEGWSVEKLKECIKFIKGKKPKIISEKYFNNSKLYLTIDVLNGNSVQYAIDNNCILVNSSDILMVMDGASSGTLYYGMNGIVGSTLSKISINNRNLNTDIVYYFLKANEDNIKMHLTGSAIPHTDKKFVKKLSMAVPKDKTIFQHISKMLADIRSDITVNNEQNARLKNIRNALLPKLMSGEIRVPLNN